MDHHYYHFDRYLAYEEYPETPVGYWWKKLQDFYLKVFKIKVSKTQPITFLQLLAQDSKILDICKKNLSREEYDELLKVLQVVKMFEEVQEKEIKIISGYPAKEDLLLKSGFGIWNKICELIKQSPEVIQKKCQAEINELVEGHPILSTRMLLLPQSLSCFQRDILSHFESEINRWVD